MWLDDNPGFAGTIPKGFGALPELESLSLVGCGLSGTIPAELALLGSNAKLLFLAENSLTGGVPVEFGSLRRMEVLQVEQNSLTETIPQEVCRLTFGRLETLSADCNICPSDRRCCTNSCP